VSSEARGRRETEPLHFDDGFWAVLEPLLPDLSTAQLTQREEPGRQHPRLD